MDQSERLIKSNAGAASEVVPSFKNQKTFTTAAAANAAVTAFPSLDCCSLQKSRLDAAITERMAAYHSALPGLLEGRGIGAKVEEENEDKMRTQKRRSPTKSSGRSHQRLLPTYDYTVLNPATTERIYAASFWLSWPDI